MTIINATVVVQAINFLIAFILIKYILYKPAVVQINAEDQLQESLVKKIQDLQSSVAMQEKSIFDHWKALQNFFARNQPQQDTIPPIKASCSAIKVPTFDRAASEKKISEIALMIAKKVSYVR